MTLIDHHKPISRNWLFWAITVAPVLLGLFLGMSIWRDMNFSLSVEGFGYFLSSSALPVGIMGLSFPLGGLFGMVHKSKQLSQQLLDYRLEGIRLRNMEYLNSVDAVLVLLYRLTNNVSLLNGWLSKPDRDHDQIRKKLDYISSSWASFYCDPKYTIAMRYLSEHFESVDAIICGYEKGILDYSASTILSRERLDDLVQRMSTLEHRIKEQRSELEKKFHNEADLLVRTYGLS